VNIRKLIREELEKALTKQAAQTKFDQDIVYLKGFTQKKKESKNGQTIWVFEHKSKDYTLRFYIQKKEDKEIWNAKVFIYWKTPSKEFTNAKGKDYEYQFGPFSSYEEMVSELNRKLQNNPLISSGNYLDDNKTQFNNDLIEMIKLLKKKSQSLDKVKDKHFDDLKNISNDIKNISTIEAVKEYINKKAPDEEDKQTLLLTLQKLHLLRFYLHKEEIEGLF
jgi:hypothetical protein